MESEETDKKGKVQNIQLRLEEKDEEGQKKIDHVV